ncbi:OLC1v1007610C2 [Oldenlandia corymbosa var. corymbosa]|nr:OLC1v1007610C2 [Oldenlandia corymbosa var. corymbosa]
MSFDRKSWRVSYKAMIVLEHLLTHGPERVAEEFQVDIDGIKETGDLQYVDEKGFNWGLQVRRKSEKILELLENRALLKEERNRARSITRGIQGFGSFSVRSSSSSSSDDQVVLQEIESSTLKSFAKCNSQFHEHGNEKENISLFDYSDATNGKLKEKQENNSENPVSLHKLYDEGKLGNENTLTSFKENRTPKGLDEEWDTADESNALLSNNQKDGDSRLMIQGISFEDDDDHPFNLGEQLNKKVSLLSTNDRVLRAF